MSNLLTRITHQMVMKCMDCIEFDQKSQKKCSLWDQDIGALVESLQQCIDLKKEYKSEYHATCKKLEEIAKGKQWGFDESIIFGQMDRFCRRLEKLIDLFSSIQQFKLLESQHIDGLSSIITDFNKLMADFKKKQHLLLDVNDTAFEVDYVEFTMNNSVLENHIEMYIEQKFSRCTGVVPSANAHDDPEDDRQDGSGNKVAVSNIMASLDLMNKFKLILHREALHTVLDQKYLALFKLYGRGLQVCIYAMIWSAMWCPHFLVTDCMMMMHSVRCHLTF